MDQIVQVIINNGIGAGCALVMLWLLWYRETKSLPMLSETFNKALSTFESAHRAGLDHIQSVTADMQESFEERNQKALDTFALLVKDERSNYQRWHEENRNRLDLLAGEVKENRHTLKNLWHELGIKTAIVEAQRVGRERQQGITTHPNPPAFNSQPEKET